MKLEIFRQNLESAEISNFMKIRVVGTELFHADRRRDEQRDGRSDMAKLTVAFRNFVNAPKHFISVRHELNFYANVRLF